MKIYKIAKTSNFQNLLQRASDAFEENFNENGDFYFQIKPLDIEKNCGSIWVDVRGLHPSHLAENEYNKMNSCGNFDITVKRRNEPENIGNGQYNDPKLRNKNELKGEFLHEITHVSQEINGFLEYESARHRKEFSIQPNNERGYYIDNHDKYKTEQEASFTQLCHLIKTDVIEGVNYLLTDRGVYEGLLHISSFKELVKKAYSLGVSAANIVKFIELLDEKMIANNKSNQHSNKYQPQKAITEFIERMNKTR